MKGLVQAFMKDFGPGGIRPDLGVGFQTKKFRAKFVYFSSEIQDIKRKNHEF